MVARGEWQRMILKWLCVDGVIHNPVYELRGREKQNAMSYQSSLASLMRRMEKAGYSVGIATNDEIAAIREIYSGFERQSSLIICRATPINPQL